MSRNRNNGRNRIKDLKEVVERRLNEAGGCIEAVEDALSKLSGVKGELTGIAKELERRKAMLEDAVSDEVLEELSDAVDILEEEIEVKKKKTAEILKGAESENYLTELKYLQAEFENYKRRAEKEKRAVADYRIEGVIVDLVDVIDNLEAAAGHAKENEQSEGLAKGVEMTLKRCKDVLDKEGVTEINAEGEQFDPFKHEVVSKEGNEDYPENTVIAVVRKGYVFRGKVIRPAMVKIAIRD